MFSANPRLVPTARLLRALHYDEAQEIASNGAKILHPRCVLPVRQYKIPLHVYATQAPGLEGTIVSANVADSAAQVKAIAIKKGITLISMESPGMWHQVGFLADAFQVFKQQGLSVDLMSTSETNVTVSLDPTANTLDPAALARGLSDALGELCRVEILGPCASLSLLGHNIRGILHELGTAFELFQDHKIYLVTQAANDLNFTFVIDESQGDRLVHQLHERLIQSIGSDKVLGPTWQQLFAAKKTAAGRGNWWEDPAEAPPPAARSPRANPRRSSTTERALDARSPRCAVKSVDRWAYAMKANWHPEILRRIACRRSDAGMRFARRARARIRRRFPGRRRARAVHSQFRAARGIRVRLGKGRARHVGQSLSAQGVAGTVSRQGKYSCASIPGSGADTIITCAPPACIRSSACRREADELVALDRAPACASSGCTRTPAAASFDVANWTETGYAAGGLAQRFPDVESSISAAASACRNRPGQAEIDLAALDAGVATLKRQVSADRVLDGARPIPGRQSGRAGRHVVTQLKGKGDVQYVGIATGMNSLIRPALYGAHHDIRNLTRLEQPLTHKVTVVGPICETADQLGSRSLVAADARKATSC
jgi:diaminopimelate decarboxylase/aspartate kinase